MTRTVLLLGLFVIVHGLAGPLQAQDPALIWNSLSGLTLDTDKAIAVNNVVLARDRIRITLKDGVIEVTQAVQGRILGAAFTGHGRLDIQPPSQPETHQLQLFAGQEALALEFSEAVFDFSDETLREIASQARWGPPPSTSLTGLFKSRQLAHEEAGTSIQPRLFKSILSADSRRTGLFAADLRTSEKGWIHVSFDVLEPEEVSAGRLTTSGSITRLDSWLSFPAGGRTASEAYRDPLAKQDLRILSYQIRADVGASAELKADAQVNLQYQAAGERVLLFELDPNLRVESVTDGQGATIPFFQARDPKGRAQGYGDYLAVALSRPTRAGQTETLEFHYSGKRVISKVGSGVYFCRSYGWYPVQPNSFATRADFEMEFRYPKSYTLVATGSKAGETTNGDVRISKWKSEIPLAVAGFAFGDYKVYSERAGAVDVEVYANHEADNFLRAAESTEHLPGQPANDLPAIGTLSPAVMAKTMGVEIGNTLRLFGTYFGPYPYKRLAVTNIPFSYGQGWPELLYLSALSFLDSTQREAMGMTSHIEVTDFFRAHEVSHQWWGQLVGWKSYHDQWMSEGFAEFSGNLYVQYRRNEKEYLNRLRLARQDLLARDPRNRVYESLGPVWMGQRLASSDSPRAYDAIVYKKGGYILHMLRMMLFDPRSQKPEERFIGMLQEFCRTFHNEPASTEDFKATAEKYMTQAMDLDANHRLDWFFRQYVYGTGIPHYEFRYRIENADSGAARISGTITQSGVPDGWKDSLRLYLHASGRVTPLAWIATTGKQTTLEFTLPVKPEKLSLNDKEDLLAEIKQ